MEKSSDIKLLNKAPPGPSPTSPCISIYIDDSTSKTTTNKTKSDLSGTTAAHENNNDDNSSSHQEEDEKMLMANSNNKMIKCKSMQNMKLVSSGSLGVENAQRYKQNLDQFNTALHHCQIIPMKVSASGASQAADRTIRNRVLAANGGAGGLNTVNYRKCLSRVNLNLYQTPPPPPSLSSAMVHSSSQHETNQRLHNNPNDPTQQSTNLVATSKLVKINPIRGVKVNSLLLLNKAFSI